MKPIKEANKITQVWRTAGPGGYPIKLDLVVQEILNKSSDGDRAEVERCSLDTIEGALIRCHSNTWGIVLNENTTHTGRYNFTWAHEIGHFVGHRHLKDCFDDNEDQLHDFESQLEKEANEFAAQLLMPQDIIRPYAKSKFTVEQLVDMTDTLGVSKQAAGLRWINVSERWVGFFVSRDGYVNWGRASTTAFDKGIFFRSGSELPEICGTYKVQHGDARRTWFHEKGVWHPELMCREEVYATSTSGFTYTCLEYFE